MIQSTRCGELDAFAVLYMLDKEGFSTDEIRRQLVEDSGLKGISGTSGDMRDVEAAIAAGDDNARLALDTYVYGVKEIYRRVYRCAWWRGCNRFCWRHR